LKAVLFREPADVGFFQGRPGFQEGCDPFFAVRFCAGLERGVAVEPGAVDFERVPERHLATFTLERVLGALPLSLFEVGQTQLRDGKSLGLE
jgi:hypothetical protein